MKNESMRLQAKSANIKSAMDMAANLILEETKIGEFKGRSTEFVVARFNDYTNKFYDAIYTRQDALLNEVETAARS